MPKFPIFNKLNSQTKKDQNQKHATQWQLYCEHKKYESHSKPVTHKAPVFG